MNAIFPTCADLASPSDPAASIKRFVESHFEGLWHAARLLGGYDAARKVENLAEALASETNLSRLTSRRLEELKALLTLKNVGDPDRVEMGCFAVIDPSDPSVTEICLLADALSDAMEAWQRGQKPAPSRPALAGSPLPIR